jgi:hypothetical protein
MDESKDLIYYQHQIQKESKLEKTRRIIEAIATPKGIEVKKIS